MQNWIALILAVGLLGGMVGWGMALPTPDSSSLPAQATATRAVPPTATVPPTYTRPPLPTATAVPAATGGPTATPSITSTAAVVAQPTALPPALPSTGVDGTLPYAALGVAAGLAAIALGIGLARRWGRN